MQNLYDDLVAKYGEEEARKIFENILKSKKSFSDISKEYKNLNPNLNLDQNASQLPSKIISEQLKLDQAGQSENLPINSKSMKSTQFDLDQNLLPLQTVGTVEKLQEAQKASNLNRLIGMLGAASGTIGASIAGLGSGSRITPDTTAFENLVKQADIPVIQLRQQMEQEEFDPNSPKSEEFRNLIKKEFGVNFKGKPSFYELKSIFPQLVNLYTAREARKQHIDELKLKLAAEKELLQQKLTMQPDKFTLEEIKDIHKENRKIYTTLDESEKKIKEKLNLIDEAKKAATKYEKSSIGGTGYISTLGGLKGYISKDLQKLQQLYNNLSLQDLTELFSGMSRAVDTSYERRKYDSTQPDITNYYETNMQALNNKKQALERMLDKIKQQKQLYNKTGGFFEKDLAQLGLIPNRESEKKETKRNIERRKDKEGRIVLFDADTKEFLGYE